MKVKNVLVTGAAGFIAYHLINRLLRAGVNVTGVDNFDPFYSRSVKEKNIADLEAIAADSGAEFQLIEKDFNDLELNEIPDAEVIVHLGAKAGVRPSLEDPESYYRSNVSGTVRLLELANKKNIKAFVMASSSSVYGDDTEAPFKESSRCDRPISPYAATKRACELVCATYCHLYEFKIPCLRFFTVYGPRQRPDLAIHKFSKLIKNGEPIKMFGDGSTGRDYTFVEDTVDGVVRAMEWARDSASGSYDIFNFGNSEPVVLKDMIAKVQAALGKTTEIVMEPMQPGDVKLTCADITHSKEVLGYNPQTSFEKGLDVFAEWFKQQES